MASGEAADADLLDDHEAFEGSIGEGAIYRLLERELGQEMADALALARATQERWERRRHPHDGLRERKKRRMRQQISDVATTLFVVRGFDHVKVSEVAEIVGVSEAAYNYFPTKESLVFDRTRRGDRAAGARAARARPRRVADEGHAARARGGPGGARPAPR